MIKNILLKLFLIVSILFFWNENFYSQNPSTCNSAQYVCTNPIVTFTANSGTGLTPGLGVSNPFTNPQAVNSGCMFLNVPNPQWLIINITSSGNLGFCFGALASAFPQAGNYDWIMWPYNSNACSDIFNNTLPPVACNFNCTGAGGTGMGTVPVGGLFCNFQPSIPVVQGQQYVILITNPSGVNTNVSFQNTGTAGVSCNPIIFPNLTACPGQLAVFTGTWVNTTAGSFTLNPGNIIQTNPSFTVSSLVNQVYTVSATGTDLSMAAINDQTTFTLTINPVIPISVSTPTNFCYGTNATFTISPSAGGTFTVSGPSVATATYFTSNISISNVTTPNIGTFSVVANYTNGCIGSQTTQVNVAPNNSITVNTTSNVCQGGSVNLTASLPTATAYAWSGPNGFVSTLQNPIINGILPASAGVYTVNSDIVFNGITCARTNTTQINVVATSPVAVTPNFTLCQGSNLNLISNGVVAVSYSWNGPATYTSALQNPTIASVLPSDAGNYNVVASFTNAALTCTMGAISNVSVVATSTVAITLPNNICQNATANLSANAVGAISYSWSGPNSFTSNIAAPSITNIQTNGSGIYTSTAMFSIGSVSCTTTGTDQISVVGTNTIAVTPNFTLCEGTNLNLTSFATSAISYSWNGPSTYTSAIQNPTITSIVPANAGNYNVVASFSNAALTCTTGAVSNVSVVPISTVAITLPNNICQNANANLSVNAVGAISYSWAGPNSFTSNIAAPTITNIQTNGSGTYTSTAMFSIGSVSCTTTGTDQINVVGTNTVAVTPNFTLCEGTNLNLTSNAVGAVSYSWNGPGTYTSALQNPIVTSVVPSDAGNYNVVASFTNAALTCTTGAVSNVSVVPIYTVAVTLPNNICQNATANLSANAVGAISYSWTGPNAFTSNVAAPSIANIQTNGFGIYTATAMFSIGSVSCTSAGTDQINVVGTNTVAVTPNFTVCEGASLNLISSAVGAVSYSWNGPGTYTSVIQNPIVPSILPANAGNYNVVASFTNAVLTCTTGAVSNVSVVSTPVVNVVVPADICQNATANLSANAIGAISYSWAGPNAFNSNIAAPTIPSIQTNGQGVYTTTAMFSIGTVSCTNTSTNQINVVPTNTVSVALTNTICEGASLNLTANATSAGSYSWNGPGGYTSALQNPTISPINTGAVGNYTATAFFTNGNLTCTTSAVSNVSVVATPAVNVIVPSNICQNATANISTSAVGAVSYLWNGPNGFTSNLANTSIGNIQTNGAGVYTSTATFAIGSVSCTNTGTNQINVVAINSITINSVTNGCALQDNVLQASSVGAVSYQWNGPSGFTAAVANPTLYNTPFSAAGIYTVTTFYSNGALTCTNLASTNLIVNPVITFTLPTSQFICYNASLTIPGPAGASSYTWQNSTGVVSNSQNLFMPNVVTSQGGTFSLTAQIGFCKTMQTTQVNVSVPINFFNAPSSISMCRGDSVKITVTSNGGSGNYAYEWSPSIYLSSSTGSIQTITPMGTVLYNLFAYDIACPTYTIVRSFTVNVKQPPLPDLRLDNTASCEPLCALYDTKLNGNAASIVYDFGGIKQIAGDNFTYCINEPGTYELNVITTGTNGCSGKFKYIDPIIVYPRPHADFTFLPQTPTLANNQVNFTPTELYGEIISRNWMFAGTNKANLDTTSEQFPERLYEKVGKFPVMLIAVTDKGCADTVFKLVEVIDDMSVYIPNTFTPNGDGKNDIFLVKGIGFSMDDFVMELFATNGNLIYSSRDYGMGWDGTVKGQPAQIGSYTYKVKVLGAHREGYKEYAGHVNLIR